ncbi:PAS domain-containing protein [Pseudomonas sp. RTC3]|uniref:PAS domain-containing protein n=1 Tax=unclassified Pseudomonas TaxID=196821 RepID=UPI002AB34509|nr:MULTISPECIES: PAS domain-containing protein [unclassified Pseudomonas]MEB0065030.1 PAS domain-containing protein [Pseudomonas sp. RTC3]MDY7564963.1 PAS domain-containing protein [Pseudomonas sp. 5C2]MEB0009171.1 PAS domain-containing protein [Pseudomonas sp. RTB2]MEB0018283.1 PAS domain-containing protein [Pseudomonas sp. RTB3]MEB0025313.1 PAS domain-containing protein [Pseudomonas sp. MH9.2]
MAEHSATTLESIFTRQALQYLDVFPIALLELTDKGEITHYNAAWADLMELPGDERNMVEYVHQEDRSLWRQALYELRRRPDISFNQRLRFVHPQGELRWFDISLKRRDVRFYLVVNDITQHKRREIALQASQRSALSLLDSMPGLIYRGRNNHDWTMEFVSAGCLQLTGYPAERLMDSHDCTYNSLIHPDDADYVWREVQYALSRYQPYELRYRIRCADNSIKNVWEKGVGIYSDSREVLGIEGAIFEIVTP